MELVSRLSEMLDDPLRYILTTTDGAIDSYNGLPSNIPNSGDCTYENLVLATSQLSGVRLSDQQNGGYANQPSSATDGAGYFSGERKDLADAFDRVSDSDVGQA